MSAVTKTESGGGGWISNSMAAISKILEINMTSKLCHKCYRLDEIW